MTFYGTGKSRRAKAATGRRWAAGRRTGGGASKGFAASPAGKHRRLAMNAFALAAKARAAGNFKHYWRMVGFGKRALALSRAEIRMWNQGKALRAKSYSAHRAARAGAAFR